MSSVVLVPSPEDLEAVESDMQDAMAETLGHLVPADEDGAAVESAVGITGEVSCLVVIRYPRAAAARLAEAMFALEAGAAATADVHDAVGEIANIIAGSVKALADDTGQQLGLPVTVVTDEPGYEPVRTDPLLSTTRAWAGHPLDVAIHPLIAPGDPA